MYRRLGSAAGNEVLVKATPSHVAGTTWKSWGVRWFTGNTEYASVPVKHVPAKIAAARTRCQGRGDRHVFSRAPSTRAREIATPAAVSIERLVWRRQCVNSDARSTRTRVSCALSNGKGAARFADNNGERQHTHVCGRKKIPGILHFFVTET